MKAELTGHVWEVAELVGLLEADEAKMIANGAMKRGPYKKRQQAKMPPPTEPPHGGFFVRG